MAVSNFMKRLLKCLFSFSDGGGDCVDPEDCNNNGICKPDSAGKGKCCCAIGFAGEACDGMQFLDACSFL